MVERLDSVTLESGAVIAPVEVVYTDHGPRDAPVILVHHALTGDAEATDWWDALVGPERPVDTNRFRVVCSNLLGGCKGTTGPSSIDPATGEAFGLTFPLFSVRDLVSVQRELLRALGIGRVHTAIGGSLGAMQALQWSLDQPEEVERAALICCTARLTAQNIAFTKVAREAILGHAAMDVARMMAHITYLSVESMGLKFDRARRFDGPMTFESDYEVEHYLDHQAAIFLARFDPLTYIYLSRTMDYFEPFAEHRGTPSTKYLVVSFDSDWRFGTEHSRYIEEQLRERGADVARHEVRSPWGHDSFLMDVPEYHALVRQFIG